METKVLSDRAVVRWSALALLAATMFFSHMLIDILSPLKTQLEQTVNWSSTVFGAYGSSEYFINVFAGFLIFAGVILDKMGIRFTAVLSGSLMVLGAGIKVYALGEAFNTGGSWLFELLDSEAFPASAKLACAGFAVFGCGSEMAGITVSRAIVKWFRGKEMALAMGLEMGCARLSVFAIFWLSPMISAHFSYDKYLMIQAPMIFVFILLCIGLVLYIVYGFFDRALDRQLEQRKMAVGEDEGEEPFRFSDLRLVFGSRMFWIVAILCMLYYSAIFPFQKFATEMLWSNVGMRPENAAKLFSLFPVGALFLTPFMGAFIDYKGKGASMLIVGGILVTVCHLTFAVFPFQEVGSAAIPIATVALVVLGVSFSLVPAALWPSIPKIIDEKVLGSAYSAIFFIQNIGLMSVPFVIGWSLDATNAGLAPEEPKNYLVPMLIFTSFGVVALLMGFVLKIEDGRKNYGLELPNKVK